MTAWTKQQLKWGIEQHDPASLIEEMAHVRFLDAIDNLAEPFSEEADPTHVTASAVVVGRQGTVLHRHKRLGLWLQLGGHIDPGESPLEAALRETFEETGLKAEPLRDSFFNIDVHDGGRGHTHLDLRFLLQSEDEPQPPEGESQDVRWFDWEEAFALTQREPALVSCLEQARMLST